MTGNVALSASVTPSGTQIPGISISPLSVSITPGSLGSSTLTISTTSSTSSGSYTIAITGTIAGTSPHSASIQVTVNPDFTINSSPTNPPPFIAGNVAITTIRLSSNGLTGTVTLSAAVPASATGASVSFTVNPIGLSAGGSGVSTLTCSTTSVTPAGTYSVTVTGSSGLIAHSVTLAITVTGDFKATVSSPTQSSFIAGGSADATITLDSLGFTGRLDIAASSSPSVPGLTTIMSPASVNLVPSSRATATLTISTNSSTPAGSYTFTVVSTSGALVRSSTITIGVSADFHLVATPPIPSIFLAGNNANSTVTLTSFGLTGNVRLQATTTPSASGLTVSFSNTLVNLQPGSTASSIVTIGTTTATPAGSYQITVSGASGSLSRSAFITVIVDPDFSISAGPVTPANFVAGSSATTTVTVGSIGLAGSVSLTGTVPVSAIGLSVSFVPSSVTLAPGSATSSVVTLSTTPTTPAGLYAVTLTAVSGSISHSVSVSVTVNADFTISASQVTTVVCGSGGASSTVTLNSLGFSGSLSLTASLSPNVLGISTSFSPSASVSLNPGTSSSSLLTLQNAPSTPSGTYTVTITATAG